MRADSLLLLGDALLRENPDSARALWELALADASASGDSARIAKALTGLGQAARLLDDYATSRRLGEQALDIKLRRGMQSDLFRSYNALGLLALNEERLFDASALLAKASDAARAARDSVALAKVLVNQGLVLQDLGSFAESRRALEGGRDASRSVGDSVTLGRALNDLAAWDLALGDPLSAIAALEEARRLARTTRDSVTEVNARGQLAIAYDAVGEPQRAFALLDSAILMAQRGGRRYEAAEDLRVLADLFLDAGDYRHALDQYGRALAAIDSLGLEEERGNILRSEARAHAALGNLALAQSRARGALALHQKAALAHPQLIDFVTLADLAARARQNVEAERFLRSAYAIAAQLNISAATTTVSLAEARFAASAGQWSRVLRSLDRTRGALSLGGSGAAAEAMALRARAYEALGQLDSAVAAGAGAISAVERVRGNYASGALRTSYVSDKADIYAQQALLLLRLGRFEEAYQVADAARGRALLEHLVTARSDVAASGAASAVLERERLLRRIDALIARLQERTPPNDPRERSLAWEATTAGLGDSLRAARAEYEALLVRGGAEGTPVAGLIDGSRASTSAVRNVLADDELLLEYFLTRDRLLIFALTRTSLTTHVVPVSANDLASRVRLARELMRKPDEQGRSTAVMRALHELLLAPVARSGALGRAKRVVIVPHSVLAYLPFSALLDPATGRYLVQDHAILHVPTGRALVELRSQRRSTGSGAVGQTSAFAFAPFPDDLPATREEAKSVAAAVHGARTFVGGDATEQRLRQSLKGEAIIHLATHATMNARNPLFSHIEMAGDNAGNSTDNGRLEVHEMLALKIDNPLVFLSGCETALGPAWSTRFDAGEDYTTIAQTLLYAGVRNVVATLWRIDDVGAGEFSRHFYGAYRPDQVPEALAQAQRAMLLDQRFRSPYYWAAYEVSGGGGRVSAPGRANIRPLADQ